MRRIIAFDHVSADGYFATADGNLDWVVSDEALTESNLQNMAEAEPPTCSLGALNRTDRLRAHK
jgi:hypothetical protein